MAKSVNVKAPVLGRDEEVDATLFAGRKRPMSRAELGRTLAPAFASWIKATCLWDDSAAIGDYRFGILATKVAPRVHVYVQFWSEPGEPVLWEVSSGHWNPPTDKWLAGERSKRIEAMGFEVGGQAENFHREVVVQTAAEATRIARSVVDIFYTCFDYRGLSPIEAHLAYESRGEPNLAYDSFSPEDLIKILEACEFRITAMDGDEDAPVIRATRRGIETTITCVERVDDEHLYRHALLTADVEVPAEIAAAVTEAAVPVIDGAAGVIRLGTTMMFDGGVTVGWVVRRLEDWDAMMASSQTTVGPRAGVKARRPSKRVH
jgi:hypothetical protein